MVMRLFLVYVIVELAVVVALASTIGFGWTVLLVLGTFLAGLVLAGSQVRRQLARLQRGLNDPAGPKGAVTDGALVALGTVLVFIPGLVTSVAGLLMLLPPTRAAVRPLAGALAARGIARRVAFINVGAPVNLGAPCPTGGGRGDYIDAEVIDVEDVTDTPDVINASVPAVFRPKP
jgi:UPF0716 protein FxsA